MSSLLRDDVKALIARGEAVCLVGEEVSAFSVPPEKKDLATWSGLLKNGLERYAGLNLPLPGGWRDRQLGAIDSGDLDELLGASEQVTSKLKSAGEFGRWLLESVGTLRVQDSAALAAIRDLRLPIVTTNYDGLLEEITGLPAVTWKDSPAIERILRGDDRGIIHLHGYFRRPETIVLGIRSREDLRASEHAQAVLRALRTMGSLLFIGFGKELTGPNFSSLLAWSREVFSESHYRHYRFVPNRSVEEVQGTHPQGERIFVLGYGDSSSDLPRFLESLEPEKARPSAPAPTDPSEDLHPRVLAAGPFFGVPVAVRTSLIETWNTSGQDEETRSGFNYFLDRYPEIETAQLSAITLYDLILDFSPWNAFSRCLSIGFRVAEGESSQPGTPLLLSPGENPGSWASLEPATRSTLRSLLIGGLDISGFGADTPATLNALLAAEPDLLLRSDAGSTVGGRPCKRAPAPLDSPQAILSLEAYRRALRVVAGRLRLPGEEADRPLADVFVDMEVLQETPTASTAEEREIAAASIRNQDHADEEFGRTDASWLGGEPQTDWMASIPGSELLTSRRNTLLQGSAGSGKSTLIKWLATAQQDGDKLRVWIPLSKGLDDGFLPDVLARAALRAVCLPETAQPVRTLLREAIEGGMVTLLLDGLDEAMEAQQRRLLGDSDGLPSLSRDCHVVVSSRPMLSASLPRAFFVLTELRGLNSDSAPQFLKRYFGDADWFGLLLSLLRKGPSAREWLKSPILLTFAGQLCHRSSRLPDSTLELYERAVLELLRAGQKRIHAQGTETQAVLEEASRLAREVLAADSEVRGATFPRSRLQEMRFADILTASGLLVGGFTLRFAHLTLAEFLASRGLRDDGTSLPFQLKRYKTDSSAWLLEFLPMTLASSSVRWLEEVLTECEHDEWDHRMLGLVFRAITYGGKTAETFSERHASKLMDLLVARFESPSGVFSEAEVRLSESARRALSVLREHLSSWDGSRLKALASMHGSVGNEARILAWSIRLLRAGRPAEDDARRALAIAEALSEATEDPQEIVALLRGSSGEVRSAAVAELTTRSPGDHKRARSWLFDSDPNVLVKAIEVLADDAVSRPALRSLLAASPMSAVISALASDHSMRPALRSFLRARHPFLREAAVRALSSDPESEIPIACLLPGDPVEREALVEVLVRKDSCRLLMAPFLRVLLQADPRAWAGMRRGSSLAAKHLKGHPDYFSHLCDLAFDKDPEIRVEVTCVLEGNPAAGPVLQKLAADIDPRVRAAALSSLRGDPSAQSFFERGLYDREASVQASAILGLERPSSHLLVILGGLLKNSTDSATRQAATRVLSRSPDGRILLAELLAEGDQEFWKAVIAALPAGEALNKTITTGLSDDRSELQVASLEALRLARWRSGLETEWRLPDFSPQVLRALLQNPDARVRTEAIYALPDGPIVDELLPCLASDPEGGVRKAAFERLVQMGKADAPTILKGLSDPFEGILLAALRAAAESPLPTDALRPFLGDHRPYIRVAAAVALAEDPVSLSTVRRILCDDDGGISAGRHMASTFARRQALHGLLMELLPSRPVSVVESAARELIRNGCSEGIEATLTAQPFPMILKAALEFLPDAALRNLLGEFRWIVRKRAAQLLYLDPRNHTEMCRRFREGSHWERSAIAFALARSTGDSSEEVREALAERERNVRYAAIQGLLEARKASEHLLVGLLERDDWTAVAAARLLPHRPQALVTLERILKSKNEDLQEQCVRAYCTFSGWRRRLGSLLSNESPRVRAAAVEALTDDPDSERGRVKLASDPDASVRSAAILSLRSGDEVDALARQLLLDGAPIVREAAAKKLRASRPTAKGISINDFVASTSMSSRDPQVLLGWLSAFVASPRPLAFQAFEPFEGAILSWLVKRLSWASASSDMESGAAFGEFSRTQEEFAKATTILVRVRMDSHRLPRERNFHPLHNLAEAWRVASHVRSPRPLSLWLACADVEFEDLVPPATDKPGMVHWGPTFYGFRVAESDVESQGSKPTSRTTHWAGATEAEAVNHLVQDLAEALLKPEPDLVPGTCQQE